MCSSQKRTPTMNSFPIFYFMVLLPIGRECQRHSTMGRRSRHPHQTFSTTFLLSQTTLSLLFLSCCSNHGYSSEFFEPHRTILLRQIILRQRALPTQEMHHNDVMASTFFFEALTFFWTRMLTSLDRRQDRYRMLFAFLSLLTRPL